MRRTCTRRSTGLPVVLLFGAGAAVSAPTAPAVPTAAPLQGLPARTPTTALDLGSWRLHVYDVPLERLGVRADAAARYWRALRSDAPTLPWDNAGVAHALARDLPSVLAPWPRLPAAPATPSAVGGGPPHAPTGAWEDDGRVLYLLPIAPYLLCASTDFHDGNADGRAGGLCAPRRVARVDGVRGHTPSRNAPARSGALS